MTTSRIKQRTHQMWARIFGYFWLACPLCKEMFGGHQWRDHNGKPSSIAADPRSPHTGQRGICPECTRAGKGSTI